MGSSTQYRPSIGANNGMYGPESGTSPKASARVLCLHLPAGSSSPKHAQMARAADEPKQPGQLGKQSQSQVAQTPSLPSHEPHVFLPTQRAMFHSGGEC